MNQVAVDTIFDLFVLPTVLVLGATLAKPGPAKVAFTLAAGAYGLTMSAVLLKTLGGRR